MPPPPPQPQDGGGAGRAGFVPLHERGLDAFLSRSAPSIDQKLNTSNYKSYRTRLDLYHRQVKRKGKEALIDGAFLLASLLQPHHPDLVENLDFDAMEASSDSIAYIIALLDKSFKYGQEVELPIRCEDFFHRLPVRRPSRCSSTFFDTLRRGGS